MKQETIEKAVKVINRSIKFYQRRLTYQLELKAESRVKNGNLKVDSFGDYEHNIQKYETILADLATIKRAIKNNKTNVKIYGIELVDFAFCNYNETMRTLLKAGLDFYIGDEYGEIWLESIDEREEREEELMAMQLNGLTADFEE